MLVNALSETSVYQSAHYSRATRGHHVVVTGHLAATSAAAISAELFHPDSGFADYNIVFLNPSPPTDAMKRLLKTSQHSHRLLYLQGSWVSQEVCKLAPRGLPSYERLQPVPCHTYIHS